MVKTEYIHIIQTLNNSHPDVRYWLRANTAKQGAQ